MGWDAPTDDGGAPITGYTVTSTPGGKTCSITGALSCVVTGLTNGTVYTFTVTATNSAGDSSASGASAAVTPMPPGKWSALGNVDLPAPFIPNAVSDNGLIVGTARSDQGLYGEFARRRAPNLPNLQPRLVTPGCTRMGCPRRGNRRHRHRCE